MPNLSEPRQAGVLGREDWLGDRPGHVEIGVVPGNAQLVGGIVKIRTLVLHDGFPALDAKTMGEARGHIDAAQVIGAEPDPDPPAKAGRPVPDVDGDVKDGPEHWADEFPLRVSLLRVQSA